MPVRHQLGQIKKDEGEELKPTILPSGTPSWMAALRSVSLPQLLPMFGKFLPLTLAVSVIIGAHHPDLDGDFLLNGVAPW